MPRIDARTMKVITGIRRGAVQAAAVLVALLCALSVVLSLFFKTGVDALLDPDHQVQIVKESQVARLSRPLIANFLVTYALKTGDNAAFLGEYPIEAWERIAEIILPETWVETNLNMVLMAVLSWLEDDQQPYPDIYLDLSPILNSLEGNGGALAVLPLLEYIPPCASGIDLQQMIKPGSLGCVPKNMDLTPIARLIADQAANSLPPQISIHSLEQDRVLTPEILRSIERVRQSVYLAKALITAGFRLSLFLVLLYGLMKASSFIRLIRSLALPFYLAGGIAAILLLIWNALSIWGINLITTLVLPELELETQALLVNLLQSTNQLLKETWLYIPAVLAGTGVLLQLAGVLIKKYQPVHTPEVRPNHYRSGVRKQFR